MLGTFKKIGTEISDKIVETKESTMEAYSNLSEVPTETKKELFNFFTKNKETINSQLKQKILEDEEVTDKLIIFFLYGMLPFPLGFLISEEVFLAFIKESPELIEVLFDNAPEILELILVTGAY